MGSFSYGALKQKRKVGNNMKKIAKKILEILYITVIIFMAIIYGICIIDEIFGPALLTDAFEKIGISYDSVMTVSWIVTGLILAFFISVAIFGKEDKKPKEDEKTEDNEKTEE